MRAAEEPILGKSINERKRTEARLAEVIERCEECLSQPVSDPTILRSMQVALKEARDQLTALQAQRPGEKELGELNALLDQLPEVLTEEEL